MTLSLTLKGPVHLPIDATPLSPEHLTGLSRQQIAQIRVQQGNRWVEVGEIIDVDGDAADESVRWLGSIPSVRSLGAGMTRGAITIEGDAGHEIGFGMRGGSIDIKGSAGDGVGTSMAGGSIRIRGNVGARVGTSPLGRLAPMTGGMIMVDGNAGPDAARELRRGTIAIRGNVGPGAMMDASAGTLLVRGHLASRCGVGMRRGTVLALGEHELDLPPTFVAGRRIRPPFLKLLFDELDRHGFPLDASFLHVDFQQHHGDMLSLGLGEILVAGTRGTAA